jgi:hypothetical protein
MHALTAPRNACSLAAQPVMGVSHSHPAAHRQRSCGHAQESDGSPSSCWHCLQVTVNTQAGPYPTPRRPYTLTTSTKTTRACTGLNPECIPAASSEQAAQAHGTSSALHLPPPTCCCCVLDCCMHQAEAVQQCSKGGVGCLQSAGATMACPWPIGWLDKNLTPHPWYGLGSVCASWQCMPTPCAHNMASCRGCSHAQ